MYWSINGYPELAGRPRDERQAILRAALKQRGRSFGFRLLIVFAGVVAGMIAAVQRFAPRMRIDDWRTWVAPVAGALLIYLYLLVEINGAVHTAVEKYLADKKSHIKR
jgi:hypothetical protein